MFALGWLAKKMVRDRMGPKRKMVVIAKLDGRIISFNTECERVTGYKQSEATGRNLLDFVPEDWRPVVQERFKNASNIDLRTPHKNPWITKDGVPVMIEWSCSFIDGDGDGRMVVGFGAPCTD